MTEVLIEDVGPNGNIQAVVEAYENVCYFYLFGAEETGFGTRSVWVRNHTEAPESLDVEGMKAGQPPMNPRDYCRHPQGLPRLIPDQLRIVWLPEGDGAALYEADQCLAIIPPWSGFKGFDGYARDSVDDGPLAWELGSDNVLIERFNAAGEFWGQWENANPWPAMQDSLLKVIETTLGAQSNYYAIDGGKWPPKAIVRIPRSDGVVLVSIGVCIRPQPKVEMSTEQPELLRRIEIGAVLPKSWSDDAIKRFASYLSAQSGFPWSCYTWLGSGHTIPCDSWQNPMYTSALLQYKHPAIPNLTLQPQFGDPVNVLWFIPITESERQIAIDRGSESMLKTLPNNRWKEA